MSEIATEAVHSEILAGIVDGAQTFIKWTKNFWVTDYGAEGLLQTRIADRLFTLQENGSNESWAIGIEISINEAIHINLSSIHKQRLESSAIKANSRPDICVWTVEHKVPFIVEVKRKWENGPALADISRCGDFVRVFGKDTGTGVRAAYFAVILHRSQRNQSRRFFVTDDGANIGQEQVEELLSKIASDCLADGRRMPLKVTAKVSEDFSYEPNNDWPTAADAGDWLDSWRWRAAVLRIESALP